MEKINSKGRTYVNGCALSQDLRKLIVDEIVRNGGDINTGYFPGKFSDVGNAFTNKELQLLVGFTSNSALEDSYPAKKSFGSI